MSAPDVYALTYLWLAFIALLLWVTFYAKHFVGIISFNAYKN